MDVKSENLELYIQDINVSLEIEELDLEDIPMIMLKSSLKVQVKDWSDQFHLNGMYIKVSGLYHYVLLCYYVFYSRDFKFKSFIL